MYGSLIYKLLLCVVSVVSAVKDAVKPEQVHLTFHPDPSKLVVTWVSFETLSTYSLVQWGSSPDSLLNQNADGNFLSFQNDYCKLNSTRSVHSAVFNAPKSIGDRVYYRLSSDRGMTWSDTYYAVGTSRDYPQTFAMYGDMGINCQVSSVPELIKQAQAGSIDFAVHFGDTAYNMNDDCGAVGDTFLNAAMGYSTLIPVVYTNGNHESGPYKKYVEFTTRLADGQNALAAASGSNNNRYFLWRVGKVTFFTVDPDAWIYPLVYDLAKPQYEWLDHALATVNRTETPWLIGAVHRAMYCTKTVDAECNHEAMVLRKGFGYRDYGLEQLLVKYGVDMYFAGHTHHYERTYPVKDGVATQHDYMNPKATVHIQSGIGGVDGNDPFDVPQQEWEAVRDTTFAVSYSKVFVYNDTHAKIQQIRAIDGSILDEFVIVQNQHGPF
jgi:hypothetical protein